MTRIGYSGCCRRRMQGTLLQRPPNDGPLLELCIWGVANFPGAILAD
jgi:hypothetical protein